MEYTSFLTPTLGAGGLLAFAVILILRGSLIPRRVVDDMRTEKDKQIDTWRMAFESGQKVQETQRQQITILLEATKTTTHVIESIPRAARLSEGGHHEVAAQEG